MKQLIAGLSQPLVHKQLPKLVISGAKALQLIHSVSTTACFRPCLGRDDDPLQGCRQAFGGSIFGCITTTGAMCMSRTAQERTQRDGSPISTRAAEQELSFNVTSRSS
jgi:hypothetical protein